MLPDLRRSETWLAYLWTVVAHWVGFVSGFWDSGLLVAGVLCCCFLGVGDSVLLDSAILGLWAAGSVGDGVLGFWGSGLLGFWDSGILGFWDSGILSLFFLSRNVCFQTTSSG